MTVVTATRAGVSKPSAASGWSGQLQRSWGTVEVSTNPAPADTFIMCKLPKGALVVGGNLLGDKLDSTGNGTACMTINIGVDKAITVIGGATGVVTAASTSTALASSWAIGPDAAAVTGYKPETGRNQPLGGLLITDGPFYTSDECNAYIAVITSAAGLTTGTMTLYVDYYMHVHA